MQLLHALHLLRVAAPLGLFLHRLAEEFRVPVEATLPGRFLLLNDQGMGLGVGILANCSDLPGDLHVGSIGADGELVIGDFLGDDRLR